VSGASNTELAGFELAGFGEIGSGDGSLVVLVEGCCGGIVSGPFDVGLPVVELFGGFNLGVVEGSGAVVVALLAGSTSSGAAGITVDG
jgi:hypothetical protein